MLFKANLARRLDQYEREENMKKYRPLKIMEYKALPTVPGTEKQTPWWVWLILVAAGLTVVYLFVAFLVGIVVLTNWLV